MPGDNVIKRHGIFSLTVEIRGPPPFTMNGKKINSSAQEYFIYQYSIRCVKCSFSKKDFPLLSDGKELKATERIIPGGSSSSGAT